MWTSFGPRSVLMFKHLNIDNNVATQNHPNLCGPRTTQNHPINWAPDMRRRSSRVNPISGYLGYKLQTLLTSLGPDLLPVERESNKKVSGLHTTSINILARNFSGMNPNTQSPVFLLLLRHAQGTPRNKQACKAQRCDSYLQIWNYHSLTHSLTWVGARRCYCI